MPAVRILSLFALVFTAWSSGGRADDVALVLARVSREDSVAAPAATGYGTMDGSPLMGNGDIMVTAAGGPALLVFHIGKTDFWMDKNELRGDSWNVLAGRVTLAFPELARARFSRAQELSVSAVGHRMADGEGRSAEVWSVTPHVADNLLIQRIRNTGTRPLLVEVAAHAPRHRDPRLRFEVDAGRDAASGAAWVSRLTPPPRPRPVSERDPAFRMWVALATRVLGAEDAGGASEFVIERGDSAAEAVARRRFSLPAGASVDVVTHVRNHGLPLSPTPADPAPEAVAAVAALSRPALAEARLAHQEWWAEYWRKSHVDLPDAPLVERVYYGALHVLAMANRVGSWPAGCNGWPVDDDVPWGGDYHWNYNVQATYYGAYSANRIEQSRSFDRVTLEAARFGRLLAADKGAPGTLFNIATAPGHINEYGDIGQKTHGVEAAMNLIKRYRTTHDLAWARELWPVFDDLALYWDHELERDKETCRDGSVRYVIRDSKPMEGATGNAFNGITGLAFLRRFYSAMLDLVPELNADGFATGRGEADLARWRRFLDGLADYPMSHAYGRKVFAWSEESLNPLLTEQDWVLYPIFPAEQVGLGSDPELLRVARDSITIKPQYYVEWLNNPPQIFSMAARVGVHPPELLARWNWYFRDLGVTNFKSGGGNTEGAGLVEAVNSFLLQSHEGCLRLFPNWAPGRGGFSRIRAEGAFLVSARVEGGVVSPITILSEKGRLCRVLNPWPGRVVEVRTESGESVATSVETPRSDGEIVSFPTRPGVCYELAPSGGLPAPRPSLNAAWRARVEASSDAALPDEAANWGADKLTDGQRLNTRAGHRGWSSAPSPTPVANEWARLDLGSPVLLARVDLWPLAHGDAWQHTHCMEPFVNSLERDMSFDGFPIDFRILASADGREWRLVAERKDYQLPHVNRHLTEQKVKDVTGPESFPVPPDIGPLRYIKVEATRLRRARVGEGHVFRLAEIEAIRAEQ